MAVVTRQSSAKRSRPAMRRQSVENLTVGLPLTRLHRLLDETLPQFDRPLAVAAANAYSDLLTRRDDGRDDLVRIDDVLSAFLNNNRYKPKAEIIFEVHFLQGMIRDSLYHTEEARMSYTRALWIASCTQSIPQMKLASTLHHLAKTYAQTGNYVEATKLLGKALTEYESCQMSEKHACMEDARQCYRISLEKQLGNQLTRSAVHRLSRIFEESESEQPAL
ncbi:hypothetical protein FisN_21Lh235 [Fistulifera solaris]|uniref:Uncharacterized protein n=1 Tax=Fistulifera solaris TaxID=1519565 RepID=A0A1Z5J9P0_FISSO|nr:hypothetical protein FisN_21Lh235 [Fistulifera solaris]|eukprot:GAX10528.1 hypothetical protein FisN_21Lh235 [Fistulifera solaris]